MRYIYVSLLCVLFLFTDAQSLQIDRALLSSAGSTAESSSYLYSWTLGEIVIDQNNSLFLTGFQQGFFNQKLNPKTTTTTNYIFSPNGDQLNDFVSLLPKNSSNARIEIFNKWGINVFRNETYIDPFDGRDESGKELNDDVYLYILEYELLLEHKTQKGLITIKRK
jgi:gliding motility-associated-like protein